MATAGSSDGAIWNEKNRKKMAANRSQRFHRQQRLITPAREVTAHVATPAGRDPQNSGHRGEGDGHGLSSLRRVLACDERRDVGQVHGHGQVLDHENVQHGWGLVD